MVRNIIELMREDLYQIIKTMIKHSFHIYSYLASLNLINIILSNIKVLRINENLLMQRIQLVWPKAFSVERV